MADPETAKPPHAWRAALGVMILAFFGILGGLCAAAAWMEAEFKALNMN